MFSIDELIIQLFTKYLGEKSTVQKDIATI